MTYKNITMTRIFTLLISLLWLPTGLLAQHFNQTLPPEGVRTMAEWEESGVVCVTWRSYPDILTEIVKAAHKETKVMVLVRDQPSVTTVTNLLDGADVDMSNVQVVFKPSTTVWIRDYGPTSVYINDVDSMLLVDWIYNRNRPADDTMSAHIGQLLGVPVYSTRTAPYDLVNTGGNFMADGLGTAFSSELVLRNNNQIMDGESSPNDIFGTSNHTAATIDEVMLRYMGIDRYIKMKELPYDGIHHIDMHMKLLDEETLLVGEYPTGISDGPQIEANIQYVLNSFKTSFGRDFKVIRIPMPSFNNDFPPYTNEALYPTYANALLVNKTILLPQYDHPDDLAAQDTFKKYMPGYEVVGINCNQMIGAGGAIHCITKEIGVPDPLRIVHAAIRTADVDKPEDWQVRATVQHRSGIAEVELFYTTDLNGPWTMIPMFYDPTLEQYVASIPPQSPQSTVYYYINATANNGKNISRPITAPEGYWSFRPFQLSSVETTLVAQMAPIYPNPARAITVVPVQFNQATKGSLRLYNALGQLQTTVFEGEFPAGNKNYFIQANRFPAGHYLVVLQTAQQFITQQLVIGE